MFASGTDYVQDTTYDEAGRVIQRRLGSLPILETSFWYYGWVDVNGRGRVGSIDTRKLSAPTGEVQSLHYWYDVVGNVSRVSYGTPDPEAPIGRSYQYDALDRLTRVNLMSPGTPYLLESYAYAETGNLVARYPEGAPGYDYGYGAQAADCPEGALAKAHAVVAAVTLTYGPTTYCYDQNGNLRRQVIGGEKVFWFDYDAGASVGSCADVAACHSGGKAGVDRVFGEETCRRGQYGSGLCGEGDGVGGTRGLHAMA